MFFNSSNYKNPIEDLENLLKFTKKKRIEDCTHPRPVR